MTVRAKKWTLNCSQLYTVEVGEICNVKFYSTVCLIWD